MLRILFVDDEQKLLDGLKRTLRPLRQEWSCEFANGGTQALQLLDKNAFDVVVTDMRMPGMDGLELLKQVKDRYPSLLRVVLSGQSELEMLIKSSGVSHQYLAKPCGLESLKSAVTQALSLKQLLSDPFLIDLASRVDAIPTAPPVHLELANLLKSPFADMDQIGNLIVKDIGMCAKVLRLANSGGFALMQPISDPIYAAGLLGFTTVQSLLSENYMEVFDMDEVWRHSRKCSFLAQEIARTLDPSCHETQNQARIAGLLHDVGQIVMRCNLPQEYGKALALSAEEGIDQVAAERRVFQTSHAELGAYIMALWSLPDPIVKAIAYHHNPAVNANAEDTVLTAVYIAEMLTSQEMNIDYAYLQSLELSDRLAEWQKACSEAVELSCV
jgi:putative nucleotidyltransferase with HDIG domain